MSTIDTAPGSAVSVTVSPQPSLVSDIVTSNNPSAAPASAASTPFVNPDSTSAIQNNAPVAAVKTTIGYTGNSTSAGQVSISFANPA
jgi:hypothetical protein